MPGNVTTFDQLMDACAFIVESEFARCSHVRLDPALKSNRFQIASFHIHLRDEQNKTGRVFKSIHSRSKKISGGGILNKFVYEKAPPRGPTPYPFMYHFSRKRYPFHIPRLELWVPFNCCKCNVI